MNAKEKKIIEKGFNSLKTALGEEKSTVFIDYLLKGNVRYADLEAFCEGLEEERRKKAEAKLPPKEEIPPLTKEEYNEILEEYGKFLKAKGIKYYSNQDFSVSPVAESGREFYTDVRHDFSDKGIKLSIYLGRLFCVLKRPVRKLEKEIEAGYPQYSLYTPKFHSGDVTEFHIQKEIPYNGIEDLHARLMAMVADADTIVASVLEQFGSSFEL